MMSISSTNSISYLNKTRKWVIFSAVIRILIVAAVPGFLPVVSSGQAESTLQFVSILHRHGERTPIFTYPTDPYQNETRYWPQGSGELLNKGKQSLFRVGKFLRDRYDAFLSRTYKTSEVIVQSVDSNRCIMSAQCLMAGLFPPVGDQVWNASLEWQPTAVQAISKSVDDMLGLTKPCAALSKEQEYVRNHRLRKQLDEDRDLVDYLTNKTGMDMNDIHSIELIYDTFLVNEEQGLKLPKWVTKDIYPDKLKSLSILSFSALTETQKMKKLVTGVLINDVISSMKQKRTLQGAWERRLNLYSAQDRTIISLWRSMSVRQDLPKPSYGATFIFELHKKENNWRVKLLYKNHANETDLDVVNIEGCEDDEEKFHDSMCDLDIFADSLEDVTVSDFDKECETSHD